MTSPAVRKTDRRPPPAPLIPTQRVGALQAAGEQLHALLVAEVRAQRMAGADWPMIARLLGVSRQAARKRWMYLDDLPVAIVRSRDGLIWFTCPETGAVIDGHQIRQVEAGGIVVEHHALCPGTRS